jgi:broad specificity phosphatase PhoE
MMDDQETWLYLARHGETAWNVAGRWMGQGITPLNDAGLRQAEALAAHLAGLGLDALYSSDLIRTMQTARIVAEATGLEIQPDARLREIDLGMWQGYTREEIEAYDGERFAAWWADRLHMSAPDGECSLDVVARVEDALNEIGASHPGERVGLVVHGGVVRSALYLTDRAPDALLARQTHNGSITVLRGRPGEWSVAALNDTRHLDAAGVPYQKNHQ